MEIYEAAKELHLTNYREDFEGKAKVEQEAKESLWKPEQQSQVEFRDSIRYIFQQDDISRDEFVANLITVLETDDRQRSYFEDVKELTFATAQKSTFE